MLRNKFSHPLASLKQHFTGTAAFFQQQVPLGPGKGGLEQELALYYWSTRIYISGLIIILLSCIMQNSATPVRICGIWQTIGTSCGKKKVQRKSFWSHKCVNSRSRWVFPSPDLGVKFPRHQLCPTLILITQKILLVHHVAAVKLKKK